MNRFLLAIGFLPIFFCSQTQAMQKYGIKITNARATKEMKFQTEKKPPTIIKPGETILLGDKNQLGIVKIWRPGLGEAVTPSVKVPSKPELWQIVPGNLEIVIKDDPANVLRGWSVTFDLNADQWLRHSGFAGLADMMAR